SRSFWRYLRFTLSMLAACCTVNSSTPAGAGVFRSPARGSRPWSSGTAPPLHPRLNPYIIQMRVSGYPCPSSRGLAVVLSLRFARQLVEDGFALLVLVGLVGQEVHRTEAAERPTR